MHRYIKHAGFTLAAMALAAGLSACKQDNDKGRDGTADQPVQQQSRSDLKSGFGGTAGGLTDTAGNPVDTLDGASAPAGGAIDDIAAETAKAADPAEAPVLDAAPEVTGSVTRADEPPAGDTGDATSIPGTSGDAMTSGTDGQLSEDERFAAELAREAEEEETETKAARKGESR